MTAGERMLRASGELVRHLREGCHFRRCWSRALAWWTVANVLGMLLAGYLTVLAVGHLLRLDAQELGPVRVLSKALSWNTIYGRR